ncbi:g11529 [Coccomyxa viridis]|uniref:RNA-dependent RNA polymerase n=1 Tax=Coccomyxa viridis TaxID=1274662 RepID=A0ABP1G8H0_9CHLO
MLIARVLVKPTRIVCLPPEVELSNRVVRHFRTWSEHFLRVSFTEEDGKRLCYASDNDRLQDFYGRQACHQCYFT